MSLLFEELRNELPSDYVAGPDLAFRRWSKDRQICQVVAPLTVRNGTEVTVELGFFSPFVHLEGFGMRGPANPTVADCNVSGIAFRLEHLMSRRGGWDAASANLSLLATEAAKHATSLGASLLSYGGWEQFFREKLVSAPARRSFLLSMLGYVALARHDEPRVVEQLIEQHEQEPTKMPVHLMRQRAILKARSAE